MNKFFLIDKPLNISSFDVIRILRKKLNIRKMGHTGTLDPLASGCLLIAIGNYTKLIPYFEKSKKEYEFTINLDGTTDSFDLAEKINFLEENKQKKFKKELTLGEIKIIIEKYFSGKITQIPPKYSALKISGKKACDLVREGKEVKMKSREVNISNIEILDFNYPSLSIRAEVSAGTYIRSIAHDLGNIVGTGGYITKLRRTKIGDLDISLGQTLEDFNENKNLDINKIFKSKEFIQLDEDIFKKINVGLKISGEFNYKIGEDLFVFDNNNQITNIISYDGEILKAKRKI